MNTRHTKALLAVMLLALAMPLGEANAADPEQIVFVFQKQKDPTQIQKTADRVAELLSAEVGKPVKALVPGDYSASVQALVNRKADFAYVSSMPFLLARRDGKATLLLAEERKGHDGVAKTSYSSVFVVAADSPIQSLDDLIKQSRTLRMCFTSPTSTSGYIMPYWRLVTEGVLKAREDVRRVFRTVAFGGGYTQALEQVLAGRADVACVSDYVLEGPKADAYLPADQRAKLRIIGRTEGVPTHLIAARDGLSDELKAKVKSALVKIAADHPDLMADVYGATRFVEADENAHVKSAIDAVEASGLPIDGLAR